MASIYPNRRDGKIVSFKFKVFLGKDENGKQIFKCKTWKPEKSMSEKKLMSLAEKESVIWEQSIIQEHNNKKTSLIPNEITFNDFVKSVWIPMQENSDLRTSTIAFYSYLLKVILPYFGTFKLKNITYLQVEKYLHYLKNIYKTNQGKTLSQTTLRHHYNALKFIFECAVKKDYITVNPVSKAAVPKSDKHKVDAFSKGEVIEFIKEVENLPLMQKTMYTLLLTTGIRRGELFGLQWNDIDFENKLVHIKRNITYTSMKGIEIGLPKSSTGIRIIPLAKNTLNLLSDYKRSFLIMM